MLACAPVHPNAFSFDVLVLASDDLKCKIFWGTLKLSFFSSGHKHLKAAIVDIIKACIGSFCTQACKKAAGINGW